METKTEATDCTGEACIHKKQLVELIVEGSESDVVEYLVSRNLTGDHFRLSAPSSNERNVCFESFVLAAAQFGHVDVMNALVARSFSLHEISINDEYGYQPIHWACINCKLSVVKCLVEDHGVSVDTTNGEMESTLSIILNENDPNIVPIVEYLIHKGATLNPDCLSNCVEHPCATSELLQLLLAHGAPVNVLMKQQPLHVAAQRGRVDFIKILLAAGADIEASDEHYAKLSGFTESVSPFTTRDRNRYTGDTAFSRATKQDQLPVLKVLYSHGANPEHQNNFGNTPVHIAAILGLYDIARYLVVNVGVTLDKKNAKGETPFAVAVVNLNKRVAKLILYSGYSPSRVEQYKNSRFNKEVVKALVLELQELVPIPRMLQETCVFNVRRLLRRDICQTVDVLPLPNTLKDLIDLLHV